MDADFFKAFVYVFENFTITKIIIVIFLFLFTVIVFNGDKISTLLETVHKLWKK